jgi:hypothetical protein
MLIEAQGREHRGLALPKRTVGARWEWVANATPRFTPGKQSRYVALYRRLGGPQGQSGWDMEGKKRNLFFLHQVSNSEHEARANCVLIWYFAPCKQKLRPSFFCAILFFVEI